MKARFVSLLGQADRPGINNLLNWLEESDFYTAPASTKHHGAEKCGLLAHSLAVYDNLDSIWNQMDVEISDGTCPALVALLHDLCKVNFYKVEMWNKKDYTTPDGEFHPGWGSYPFYVINDTLPYGHGEKSVDIIRDFIELTVEERMAIRWHMAGFDPAVKDYAGACALQAALQKYPLITALHMADLAATYFDGK